MRMRSPAVIERHCRCKQLTAYLTAIILLMGIAPLFAQNKEIDQRERTLVRPVAVVDTSKPGIITVLRSCTTRVRPKDPKRFAIRWSTRYGPATYEWSYWQGDVDWMRTIASMHVRVVSPDGRVRQFHLDPVESDDWQDQSRVFYVDPTLYLTLPEPGIKTGKSKVRWFDVADRSFSAPGIYRVSMKGKIVMLGRLPGEIGFSFESGEIAFEVTNDCPTFAETVESADAAMKGKHTSRIGDLIAEDDVGHRVVLYRVNDRRTSLIWKEVAIHVDSKGNVRKIREKEKFSCLARGTPVATATGSIPVEQIKVGMRIRAFDLDTRRQVTTRVLGIRRGSVPWAIRFARNVLLSPDHPVYAAGSWKLAARIQASDALLRLSGKSTPADVLRRVDGPFEVFDLTVAPPHNFFAGDILVHNKSMMYTPDTDLWYSFWPRPMRPSDPVQRLLVDAVVAAGGSCNLTDLEKTKVGVKVRFWWNGDLSIVPFLRRLKNLAAIEFSNAEDVSNSTLETVSKIRRINSLVLYSGGKFDATGLRHLQSLSNLRELSLRETPVTDAGLKEIGRIVTLQELSLAGTKITNKGLVYLSQLKDLRTLDLTGAPVTDDGLASIIKLTRLEELNLRNTNVGRMDRLVTLKRLRFLMVPHGVTGVETLRRALPDCEIIVQEKPPEGPMGAID